MSQQPQENKMGVMPVGRLLFSVSLPMMISMLVQALYNVVDSIFVAQINENALTAVGLAFPFQNLMIAVATGTGVGINALLSRSLGEKNYDTANKAALNGIFLAVLSGLAFTVVGLFSSRAFFAVQTDIAEIVEYGTTYLLICSGLCMGIFVEVVFNRLLQSTGRTIFNMVTQGVGAIINIIMDPVLIFGYGPFPELGVAGAAIATVLGQWVAAVIAVICNFKFNKELHLHLRGFRPEGAIIRRIYSVGIPSILLASISSVMTFGMNKILMAFSSTATAVFGVYYKLQSFVIMPVLGLNNGLVPIIAYNYGARYRARIVRAIKLAMITAVCIVVVGLIILQIFPGQILLLFSASQDMLGMGIPALRIISFNFLFAGVCIISISTFQALGKGVLSMIISFVRQLVVLLPVAWLLSLTGDVNKVWLAFPIAEAVAVVLSLFLLRRTYARIIKPLDSAPAE